MQSKASVDGSFSCIREICPVNRWLRKCPPSRQAVAWVHSLVSGFHPSLAFCVQHKNFEKHGWQPCLSTAVWNCLWYLAVFINIRRVNEAPRHPANTPCYTAISLSLSTKELLGSCLRPSSLPHRPQGASQRPPACTQLPATTEGDLCDLLIFHKCTNRRGRI